MAANKKKQDAVLVTTLAKGATVAQAALQAGVSERTAYRRLQQPEFQERIDALQEETLQRAAAVLTAAAQQGIHSLVALQEPSTPPAVRRAAARDILEMGLRLREVASTEKRLLALERHSAQVDAGFLQADPARSPSTAKRQPRGQTVLILALASGASLVQAAHKAGLSERTVCRRLQDKAVQNRIETLRAEMVQRSAALLIAATLLAAKTLIDLQNGQVLPAVRRRAARDILEMSQTLRQVTVLEKRLAALENGLAAPPT
jgi:phage terminase small subunit